jgi:hypothetical protein
VNDRNNIPAVADNGERRIRGLDLSSPLRLSEEIKRYRMTKDMLPQKADIELDRNAEFPMGSSRNNLPRRTYRGKPGEWGIPKRA